MVEEHRVHGFPDPIVASEREGEVADTAACLRIGQVLLYPTHGTDEIDGIGLMLFDARPDGKDVDVEDDVLRRKADGGQQVVGSLSDGNLPFVGRGLPFLVEGHHDHRGSQASQLKSFGQKVLLSGFEADGVDDALALCVLQPGQDCRPVAAVNHQDGLRYGGFSADVSAEGLHFLSAVEHCVVHVDVDDRCPALYLIASHGECFAVLLLSDEAGELTGAGHVRPFPDVGEVLRLAVDEQRFEA